MQMAKRYTSTVKWDDDWFVGLAPEHKLFWFYICDRCDHAGIWQVSSAIPSRLIGQPVDLESALAAFGDRIEVVKPGYWRLTKFLEFQYGLPLSPTNKVHVSACKILESFGIQAPTKPLPSPYQGAKDKDKDTSIPITDLNPTNRESDFDIFWKAYPRKVSKGDAIKAWAKQKPPLDACLAALAWQRKQAQWLKEGGDWIPYPASWINDFRWLDEKESGRGNGTGRMERPAGIKFDDKGEVIF